MANATSPNEIYSFGYNEPQEYGIYNNPANDTFQVGESEMAQFGMPREIDGYGAYTKQYEGLNHNLSLTPMATIRQSHNVKRKEFLPPLYTGPNLNSGFSNLDTMNSAYSEVFTPSFDEDAPLTAEGLLSPYRVFGQSKSDSKGKAEHTPRPANSFILYRREKHAELVKQYREGTAINNNVISKVVASMWREETPEIKASFAAKAEEEKQAHLLKYPGYKYRPRKNINKAKSPGKKSPSRKRMSIASDDACLSQSMMQTPVMDHGYQYQYPQAFHNLYGGGEMPQQTNDAYTYQDMGMGPVYEDQDYFGEMMYPGVAQQWQGTNTMNQQMWNIGFNQGPSDGNGSNDFLN